MLENSLKNIKIDNFAHSIIISKIHLNKKISINNRKNSCLMIRESGETIYYHNGNEYRCDNNHVLFIPKNATYDFVVKNSGICHQINFNLEENFNNITSIKILNPDIINLFKESTKTYINDASNITKQYAIIYDILTKLDHETHKSSIFRNAQQLIQQELSNPKLDNAYIADKLNISEVYLRKLFNKNLNTSPRQYIIKTRMEKALSLLVNDYSISKIAGIVGYESVFSFSRAFKDYYKESPVKYFKKYT